MAHIECHSYVTGRDVKYPLIGVKLKHKEKNEDYGAYLHKDNSTYWNTSPSIVKCEYKPRPPYGYGEKSTDHSMYTTSGGKYQTYSASGILESEYENYNTGVNPIITSSTYDVNDFESGLNTRELFETDTVKIVLEVTKCKISEIVYPEGQYPNWVGLEEGDEVLYSVYVKYILKSSDTVIGIYDMLKRGLGRYGGKSFPVTFTISTELWCIKDFVPKYKSSDGYSSYYNLNLSHSDGSEHNGLYIDGTKSQEPGNFIGASFTMLCSECWGGPTSDAHKFKLTKDNVKIKNSELRVLNNKAGILYYRHMIKKQPDEFIIFDLGKNGETTERLEWCNTILAPSGYGLNSDTISNTYDVFSNNNFFTTRILMPCVTPTTFNEADRDEEGMFISLTNNILEGPAPEQEPDEEPLDPETVEPADNPETEYEPPRQVAFEDFPYRGTDTVTGLELNYNLFRPSYSNYIFPKYYRDSIEGDSDWESAIAFIQEACNPSAFEAWRVAFNLITGHPTPGEIISRVYYLPFEYTEIRGTESAGFYFSAPVYGPIGPVTLGAKTHSEDPANTGKPIESNVHYYQQIVNRFKQIDLGQVTIKRVFNNFLDFSDVTYTLNLPYGAGQVELDPDLLFKNDISSGNVKLVGVIDFDTGELTIIVRLNGQLYYETTVNVAIDRLASVADNMAAPLAIAKATMAAAATAGGVARGIVTMPQSGPKPADTTTPGSAPTDTTRFGLVPTNSWYSQIPDDDLMEYEQNFITQKGRT